MTGLSMGSRAILKSCQRCGGTGRVARWDKSLRYGKCPRCSGRRGKVVALAALLTLTACGAHEPTGRPTEGGGSFTPPEPRPTAPILGTDGNDTLVGGPGPDRIEGGDGDELLIGDGPLSQELLDRIREQQGKGW